MYLYNSLRAYTRQSSQRNPFVLLEEHDTENSRDMRCQSNWADISDIKVDEWMEPCRTAPNSTIPKTRGRFSPKKLREKIGIKFSCFGISHLRNVIRIKSRPTASSSLKAMIPRKSLTTNKRRSEKSGRDVQIRVIKSHFEPSEKWPTSTIVSERELCTSRPCKKAKKPRQITRYYSPRIVEARSPATIYCSNQRVQGTGVPNNKSRSTTHDPLYKSDTVGRHLEWLKFLV
ncbi:hypothetical protein GcM3_183028 [Golovinomyces cichoracearum]|uniref:Uncharacterized protein n=1 Tax=Golovinomyces cichoracearum TaxID=62708 RepID=A0A420HLJ2_9PEZI|nr:hypothetical protein GcM3_183028 [Golovinomyces cichoracearum]